MKFLILIFVLLISSLVFASDRDEYLDQFKTEELKEQEALQRKQAQEAVALKEKQEQEEAEAQKKLMQMMQEIQQRQGNGEQVAKPAAPAIMPTFMENPAAMVRVTLKPLRENMTEQQVSDLINNKAKGTFAEKLFVKFPKVPQFITKALRDEKALPEAARMAEDKKKLGIFAACNIATIFIGFLLKRRKSASIVTGFLFRITVLYGLRIGIFIHFFRKEASPLWNLFVSTFF